MAPPTRDKDHVSFRLDSERLNRLRKLGEQAVPSLPLTYMVEKAVAEYLERHEEQPAGKGKGNK